MKILFSNLIKSLIFLIATVLIVSTTINPMKTTPEQKLKDLYSELKQLQKKKEALEKEFPNQFNKNIVELKKQINKTEAAIIELSNKK